MNAHADMHAYLQNWLKNNLVIHVKVMHAMWLKSDFNVST